MLRLGGAVQDHLNSQALKARSQAVSLLVAKQIHTLASAALRLQTAALAALGSMYTGEYWAGRGACQSTWPK